MKWSENLSFGQPLRDVRRLTDAPTQEWEQMLRQREEAAYARGQQDGQKALSAQLLQQRADTAALQQGILEALRQSVPQVVQQTESALIELALESAQKVVAGLPVSPELIESVVREALSQVQNQSEVVVQLHPEDLALLRKQDAAILNEQPEGGALRFAASPELSRGSCLVQTRFGFIDARRETKLDQLRQTLCA